MLVIVLFLYNLFYIFIARKYCLLKALQKTIADEKYEIFEFNYFVVDL